MIYSFWGPALLLVVQLPSTWGCTERIEDWQTILSYLTSEAKNRS